MSPKIWTALFLTAFTWGCIDEISLPEAEENASKLVIQGSLIHGNPARVEVFISQSDAFPEYGNLSPVAASQVRLLDASGNSLDIPPVEAGTYQLSIPSAGNFSVATGNTYQLEVALPNGQVYRSSPEPLLPVPSLTGMNTQVITRQELNNIENLVEVPYLQIKVSTPLLAENQDQKSYFKWGFEGTYQFVESTPPSPLIPQNTCYIPVALELENIHVLNGFEVNADFLSDYTVFEERIDYKFSLGFYMTVYQQSLSESAFRYWNQVREVSQRSGSLFEVPPGRVTSNLRNLGDPEEEVLGFFYATAIDTSRWYISPQAADLPSGYCNNFEYSEGPETCRDCLRWPGATLVRPDFWVQ